MGISWLCRAAAEPRRKGQEAQGQGHGHAFLPAVPRLCLNPELFCFSSQQLCFPSQLSDKLISEWRRLLGHCVLQGMSGGLLGHLVFGLLQL